MMRTRTVTGDEWMTWSKAQRGLARIALEYALRQDIYDAGLKAATRPTTETKYDELRREVHIVVEATELVPA